MWNVAGRIAKVFLSISAEEVLTERRGFSISDPGMRERLERIGATFILGYQSGFEVETVDELESALNSVDPEWRGFAYEGAAMALALLDYFTLGRLERLGGLLRGPGDAHSYMVHVGAGWAMARMPVARGALLPRLDPLLKWLAIDGLGFHEGYFHWGQQRKDKRSRKRPGGYGARAFDQGLGRSLWFVDGGDVDQISAHIAEVDRRRRGDLWSGIGLACAYAGGLLPEQLTRLKGAAGCYGPRVALGAAFAAKARQRAGNPAAHTERACQVLCGISAADAAAVTDLALGEINSDEEVPTYELWRRRVASIFGPQERITV